MGQTLDGLWQMADLDVVLTTSYAGYGTVEAEVSSLLQEVRAIKLCNGVEPQGSIVHYGAVDISSAAQLCLENHTSDIQHRFSNVLGRLSSYDRRRLVHMQDKRLADYKQMKTEKKLEA